MDITELSPRTSLRFLSLNSHGSTMPVRYMILGYGVGDKNGLDHRQLAEIFHAVDLAEGKDNIYAGYLSVHDGNILIPKGGSSTFGIEADKEKEGWLLDCLGASSQMKKSIIELFPLITRNRVPHVLIYH